MNGQYARIVVEIDAIHSAADQIGVDDAKIKFEQIVDQTPSK